jgi:hypothetical protein
MVLTIICIGIALWTLYMGFKFYRRTDWDEPAEFRPDFAQMRKREADLLRIQEVLRQEQGEGKLSAGLVEEYDRFLAQEIAQREKAEDTWKERKGKQPIPERRN